MAWRHRTETIATYPAYGVALLYATVGSICTLRYLYLDLADSGTYVPPAIQALCVTGALSGVFYFIKREIGLYGLMFVSFVALYLAMTDRNAPAITFHVLVLAILCLPFLPRWHRTTGV